MKPFPDGFFKRAVTPDWPLDLDALATQTGLRKERTRVQAICDLATALCEIGLEVTPEIHVFQFATYSKTSSGMTNFESLSELTVPGIRWGERLWTVH